MSGKFQKAVALNKRIQDLQKEIADVAHERDELWLELWLEDGFTQAEIAERTGAHRQTVFKRLVRLRS